MVEWLEHMPYTQPTLVRIPAGGPLLHVTSPSLSHVSYLSAALIKVSMPGKNLTKNNNAFYNVVAEKAISKCS